MKTKIAILGGGNGAYAAAVDLTNKGNDVILCPRKAPYREKLFKTKELYFDGAIGNGKTRLYDVTEDIEYAITSANIVLVIVPAIAHKFYAKKLGKFAKEGQIIYLLPGTFGSMIVWNELVKNNNTKDISVAETNTLPYATRLVEDDKVLVMSRFHELKLGVIPSRNTEHVSENFSKLYDGVIPVESVVAAGLSSLNPVIHVPGCILNAGRIELAKGDFWFYTEGFGPVVVRATLKVDEERQEILKNFDYKYDMVARGIGGDIRSDDLSEVIAGNKNFAKIKGPDNFENRYFSEDIPFGIASWAKLAKHIGVDTPIMDSMVNLAEPILQYNCWEKGPQLKDWGIDDKSLNEIKDYLLNG